MLRAELAIKQIINRFSEVVSSTASVNGVL